MNTIGIALVWCVLQVTLVGLLSAGLYLVAHRKRPAAAAPVALTGLLVIVLLSALAMSPWPRWSLDRLAAATTAAPRPEVPPAVVAEGALGSTPAGDPVPSLAAEGNQRPSAERPSLGALFWRALADELARSQPGAATASWRWPAVVAIVFLAGVAGGLAWLGLGLWAVRSHRARSRPVKDPALLELVDVLCAELGCRRPIEVRQSDELVSAATLGWRRPVILLPAEWTGWTGPQRRAVLAHEIVHVCRSDFLAVVLGQLGVVLHFYHPLVHWLMGRLRLEQELAADAAAAGRCGGQRPYLAMIAELALRQQDRPLAWPARSFLPTRNAFLRRIDVLRNSKVRLDRLSPATRMLAVGAVVVCGLLAAGLRGPAGDRPAPAIGAEPAAATPAAAVAGEIDLTHVPRDAAAFVAVRAAALVTHPGLGDLRKLLAEPGGPAEEYTLPAEEIRQVTYVIPKFSAAALSSPMYLVMILQAKAPYDFRKFIDREVPKAAAQEFAGATYYASPKQVQGAIPFSISIEPCYFRPDDRTLVCSKSEQALRDFIALRRGGPPSALGVAAWKRFQGEHAVVVIDPTWLRASLPPMGRGSEPVALGALAPLWEETTALAVGLRVDDRVRLHAAVFGRTPEGAEKVQQTLDSARTLAGNLSRQFRAEAGKRTQPDVTFIQASLDVLDKLIDQVRIEREGNLVTAQTSADVELVRRGPLGSALWAAQEAARRTQSANNLKQIALAMHNYHDKYKLMPAAVRHSRDGKIAHSWRVTLLPFLGENELYKQYRFDEPWDGPNNRKLLAKRPAVYGSPKESDKTRASYFALVGPGTMFEGSKQTRFADITDGSSNTILLVEARRDIPWTKPEDIPYDPNKPLPEVGGYSENGFLAAMADATVRFIASSVDKQLLRRLIERNDGGPAPASPAKVGPSR